MSLAGKIEKSASWYIVSKIVDIIIYVLMTNHVQTYKTVADCLSFKYLLDARKTTKQWRYMSALRTQYLKVLRPQSKGAENNCKKP